MAGQRQRQGAGQSQAPSSNEGPAAASSQWSATRGWIGETSHTGPDEASGRGERVDTIAAGPVSGFHPDGRRLTGVRFWQNSPGETSRFAQSKEGPAAGTTSATPARHTAERPRLVGSHGALRRLSVRASVPVASVPALGLATARAHSQIALRERVPGNADRPSEQRQHHTRPVCVRSLTDIASCWSSLRLCVAPAAALSLV